MMSLKRRLAPIPVAALSLAACVAETDIGEPLSADVSALATKMR
ncbi:uncharacterized protein SOCE26_088840 [Sorangium cellulosum]|uniref:Secreted protein n=1 Tax=Sorangium cellulosum TaxID=56 RepID=A0A2L0F717_SORCE|nr:uncharacterized protein SOCE26_088840 [Sorangium cellulosum]